MRRAIGLRVLIGLTALALTTALAVSASASVQLAVLFDDLVRDSSAVCVFTGLEQKTAWEDGRIYTRTRARCDAQLAGEVKQGQEVWIRTMGGVVDGIGQSVSGEASIGVGFPAIVFVHNEAKAGAYEVTARGQGHFPLAKDPSPTRAGERRAQRGPDVGAVLPVSSVAEARVRTLARAPMTPLATQPAVQALPGLTETEIAKEVALAWTRTHAR